MSGKPHVLRRKAACSLRAYSVSGTLLVHGLTEVTNNEKQARRIARLTVENWLKP